MLLILTAGSVNVDFNINVRTRSKAKSAKIVFPLSGIIVLIIGSTSSYHSASALFADIMYFQSSKISHSNSLLQFQLN